MVTRFFPVLVGRAKLTIELERHQYPRRTYNHSDGVLCCEQGVSKNDHPMSPKLVLANMVVGAGLEDFGTRVQKCFKVKTLHCQLSVRANTPNTSPAPAGMHSTPQAAAS